MSVEIVTIPCLADNYAYLIHVPQSGATLLIDAPEAPPIEAELARRGWQLTHILITHHHYDHVDGLAALRGNVEVIGNLADAHRLPPLDTAVHSDDVIERAGLQIQLLPADGHTIGHIAYYIPDLSALFSGDSLMVHGCGRLFEGTPSDMHKTTSRFSRLPDTTLIYSGHDYAGANLSFAASFAPDETALTARQAQLSQLSKTGQPTIGVTLGSEKLLNPYLRVHLSEVKSSIDRPGATDLEVFTEIRLRKDNA